MRKLLRILGIAAAVAVVAAGLVALLFYRRLSRPDPRIGMVVSAADRAADSAELRAMGYEPGQAAVVLERPFDEPLSGRSFIVPRSWLPSGGRAILAARRDVNADSLLLDLDVLERAMSRQYGGWESAERAGWNWERWFDDWRGRLRAARGRTLSADEAFAPVDSLSEFRLDNHTNIPLMRFSTFSLSQSAMLERAPKGICTAVETAGGTRALRIDDAGHQPRRAATPTSDWSRLEPIHYVALPSRLGALRRVQCGGEWIDLRPGRLRESDLWTLLRSESKRSEVVVERLAEDAVYIRLPTFNPGNYRISDEVRASWPKPNGRERTLIIDIRDNGGGGASFAFPVLRPWLDLTRLASIEQMRSTLSASCLYEAFRWNFGRQFMGRARAESYQKFRVDSMLRIPPGECPRRTERFAGTVLYRRNGILPSASGRRIIVVTNGGCASDCEYLMSMLAPLEETVFVGTNSGGVMQFIQPGYGVLPHTKLGFRFALGESDDYGDGRSVDGHGLDVDVLIPEERDVSPRELLALRALLDRP